MKRLVLALPLPLLLAAGCATSSRPYAPVSDVAYQAMGARPFWMLTIGGDRIVFRISRRDGDLHWERTLPRTRDGARIWESGEGERRIIVEARAGPCAGEGDRAYEDQVVVRFGDGGEFRGCGGRMLERGAGR
ncbi:MAG TPA: hypothetical protein VGO55_03795 [Allosphingosinicella sp.]|jgi:uncharacterized membrane protein|nr:hypothetical protein [Allosphingosinicella sp.]